MPSDAEILKLIEKEEYQIMTLLQKENIDPYYFRKRLLEIDTIVDNEDNFVLPYLWRANHTLFTVLKALHIYYEDIDGILVLNPEFNV